jgi:hypothetical protein
MGVLEYLEVQGQGGKSPREADKVLWKKREENNTIATTKKQVGN